MVIGYHVIFGAYGFWLPNDPRGSWSDFVGSWELFQFGPATKTDARHSVAGIAHDREARLAAKEALQHPAIQFSGVQARAIGRGFAASIEKGGVIVWACSIMPDHVHLVVARHERKVETLANFLKGAATRALIEENLHPFLAEKDEDGNVPKCWARGQWAVFLDTPERVLKAVAYVENNPLKEGKPAQRWPFVVPYVPEAV